MRLAKFNDSLLVIFSSLYYYLLENSFKIIFLIYLLIVVNILNIVQLFEKKLLLIQHFQKFIIPFKHNRIRTAEF